jgi:hypothetical protein
VSGAAGHRSQAVLPLQVVQFFIVPVACLRTVDLTALSHFLTVPRAGRAVDSFSSLWLPGLDRQP